MYHFVGVADSLNGCVFGVSDENAQESDAHEKQSWMKLENLSSS